MPLGLKSSRDATADSPPRLADLTLDGAMPAFLNSLSGALHLQLHVSFLHTSQAP